MINRILRAWKLDKSVFSEVASDPKLMNEAIIIVVVATVAAAIGGFLLVSFFSFGLLNLVGLGTSNLIGFGVLRLVLDIIVGIGLGWVLWSWISQYVAKKWQGGTTGFPETLRALAYALSPLVLGVLRFIPVLGGLIYFAASIYSLVLGFFAIREIQKFDNTKTAINVAIGWVIFLIATIIVGSIV